MERYRVLNDRTQNNDQPLGTHHAIPHLHSEDPKSETGSMTKSGGQQTHPTGGHKTDEFIWDTVMQEFANHVPGSHEPGKG